MRSRTTAGCCATHSPQQAVSRSTRRATRSSSRSPPATGAVVAANAAQEALAPGPIAVRMGLHTGTPSVAAEGYVGIDVHRGARVAAPRAWWPGAPLGRNGSAGRGSTPARPGTTPTEGLRCPGAAVPARAHASSHRCDPGRRRPSHSGHALPRPRAGALRRRDAVARARAAAAHDRRPWRNRQDAVLDRAGAIPGR